ncbi:MAG: hypothetical protein WB579_16030 [Bryobacteraceae bacterium]
MSKDLRRRIEKLERPVGVAGLETKLRAVVRWWGGDEEAHLRALRGYERELGQALGEGHTITWEGLQLLGDLLDPSRHASPTAGRKGAPAEPGLKSNPRPGEEPFKGSKEGHV